MDRLISEEFTEHFFSLTPELQLSILLTPEILNRCTFSDWLFVMNFRKALSSLKTPQPDYYTERKFKYCMCKGCGKVFNIANHQLFLPLGFHCAQGKDVSLDTLLGANMPTHFPELIDKILSIKGAVHDNK